MRMKIFFSLKVSMGYYWLLKTLKVYFFFFWKSKCPKNQNQNISFGVEPNKAKSCTLATQWRVPAHMGLIRVTTLFQAMPWSLFFALFPMSQYLSSMGSCKVSRRDQCSLVYRQDLYGSEELTLQFPWAQQWFEVGDCFFQTLRYFTLKCQNMLNVAPSSQKTPLFIIFRRFFESFYFWQKATFCIEKSNFSY